jgi:hypothetical protein
MWSIQGGFVWNHPLGINREYDPEERAWKWTLDGNFQAWDTGKL